MHISDAKSSMEYSASAICDSTITDSISEKESERSCAVDDSGIESGMASVVTVSLGWRFMVIRIRHKIIADNIIEADISDQMVTELTPPSATSNSQVLNSLLHPAHGFRALTKREYFPGGKDL